MNNKIVETRKTPRSFRGAVKFVDISFGGEPYRHPPPTPEDNIVQQTNEWSEAADERWVYWVALLFLFQVN